MLFFYHYAYNPFAMNNLPANFTPLRYTPAYEQPTPEEAQILKEIIEVLTDIMKKTYASEGHAIRSVHAKSHAILKGELQVYDSLPDYLAQGLFAKPGTYPILVRFSSQPGDVLPDSVSTPRGFSVKVAGVEGDRLPGSDESNTQDFILVNSSPVFPQSPQAFLDGMKRFDMLTNKAEWFKEGLSKTLRAAGKVSETLGGPDAVMAGMGGQPEKHPMGDTYYSQGAILFGNYMAKISFTPISSNLTSLTDSPIDVDQDEHAIRHLLQDFFATNGGEWEVGIQLCTDINKMPIEDASVEWPEDESPYLPVGKLIVPQQSSWTDDKAAVADDKMLFSVWHGLAAHRPLGAIQRLRKDSYKASADFRRSKYGSTSNINDVK